MALAVVVGVVMLVFGLLKFRLDRELRLQRRDDGVHHRHRLRNHRRVIQGMPAFKPQSHNTIGKFIKRSGTSGDWRDPLSGGAGDRGICIVLMSSSVEPLEAFARSHRPGGRHRRRDPAAPGRRDGRRHRLDPKCPCRRSLFRFFAAIPSCWSGIGRGIGGSGAGRPGSPRTYPIRPQPPPAPPAISSLRGRQTSQRILRGAAHRRVVVAHRVAVSAGAQTRWAGIFAGIWLALLVLLAGSVAELIPMPVIGGLILVIGAETDRRTMGRYHAGPAHRAAVGWSR